MNPPRVIHLLTQRIRVVQHANLVIPVEHAPHAATEGAIVEGGIISLNGLASLDNGELYIDKSLGADKMRETLLHESMHFVTTLAGLKLEYDAGTEEAIVKRITPILLSLLRENPNLVEYLTSRD